ncbi:MAG: RidA family protein [Planctomycetota bacterium]|nr:RidA family protein [Planctomycetota bacterium]
MGTRAHIVNPPGWKRPRGYSNAVVLPKGRPLFIAGMVGWDENERFQSDDFAHQFHRALLNIKCCVEQAGSRIDCIGRLTIFVSSKQEYIDCLPRLGALYREVMGEHYPAMALVEVSALLEEGAKVEIEATGVVPD